MSEHLTLKERYQIWALFENGKNRSQIAREIGRHRSSISRELKRNKSPGESYEPEKAEKLAKERKQNAHKCERFAKEMKEIVKEKLKEIWSPEQISGYCKKHKINMVSYETIYQYIREDKANGGALYKGLRHANKRRKKYGAEEKRGQIKNKRSIDNRPQIVDEKNRFKAVW